MLCGFPPLLPPHDNWCSMRVLIVEDELRLAENLTRALRESNGFAVDHAEDGLDGEHLAQQGCYDLIILDLMLPGQSGLSLLKRLRAGRNTTPVLVLTAREGAESIVELLNAGAPLIGNAARILSRLEGLKRSLVHQQRAHASQFELLRIELM